MKRIRLAQRRRMLGLTQEALAEQLHVDVATVRRWEHGQAEPKIWQRPNLASALKLSLEELDVGAFLGWLQHELAARRPKQRPASSQS